MLARFWIEAYLRKLRGPPVAEKHQRAYEDCKRLVCEARGQSKTTRALKGRLLTIKKRRGDIPLLVWRKVRRELEL
jgi:hypothetical protein